MLPKRIIAAPRLQSVGHIASELREKMISYAATDIANPLRELKAKTTFVITLRVGSLSGHSARGVGDH